MSDKLSERVSTDGPKPLSESSKAAILEIQDRTQREVIIPHYGTYHEQKKALFSQIKITNELREHCGKTEKLLVETQAKLAALLKPVERVSMSTEKADLATMLDEMFRQVCYDCHNYHIDPKHSPAPEIMQNSRWGHKSSGSTTGYIACYASHLREIAAKYAALLKPQGETPEGGGKEPEMPPISGYCCPLDGRAARKPRAAPQLPVRPQELRKIHLGYDAVTDTDAGDGDGDGQDYYLASEVDALLATVRPEAGEFEEWWNSVAMSGGVPLNMDAFWIAKDLAKRAYNRALLKQSQAAPREEGR